MELSLHANATTTPKTRAYIQRSKKTVAELAAELGVNETTIRRWRGRDTVRDHSHRPKTLTTSLAAIEEIAQFTLTSVAAAARGRRSGVTRIGVA